MAAYAIYQQHDLQDSAAYDEYQRQARQCVVRFGGKQIVGTGDHRVLEGESKISRITILEFPDMAALDRWYNSDEFRSLTEMRQGAATGTFIVAEGFVPAGPTTGSTD